MPHPTRRWLLGTALAAALLLAAVWRQPWRARPAPAPTATIAALRPTATAATVPDRLALPTAPTAAVALPTPAPATPTPPADAGLRAAAGLLYVGILDDRPGIVAVGPDGARRLLAVGRYAALAWSPDGARFAALGGDGYEQLALFAADGRPLARYPLRAGTACDLRWSPDARFVACIPAYPFQGRERTTIAIADEGGLREALIPPVVRAEFLGWPAPGVLGLVAYPEEWPYAAAEVWTVRLADGAVEPLIAGDFLPLGWSPDGARLLALGGRQLRNGNIQPTEPVFTELIAVDPADGTRRTLARADDLARIPIIAAPAARHWFTAGSPSPDGQHLALWLASEPSSTIPGPPGPPGGDTLVLLALDATGTSATIVAARLDGGLGPGLGWSPDGQRLAYPRYDRPFGTPALAILARTTPIFRTYPLGSGGPSTVAWSPDRRRFAYTSPQGLTLADTDDAPPLLLDLYGRAPAWRPAPR